VPPSCTMRVILVHEVVMTLVLEQRISIRRAAANYLWADVKVLNALAVYALNTAYAVLVRARRTPAQAESSGLVARLLVTRALLLTRTA
jgi:hypothetical protein